MCVYNWCHQCINDNVVYLDLILDLKFYENQTCANENDRVCTGSDLWGPKLKMKQHLEMPLGKSVKLV